MVFFTVQLIERIKGAGNFLDVIKIMLKSIVIVIKTKIHEQTKPSCLENAFFSPLWGEDSHCIYRLCFHDLLEASLGAKDCLSS